MKSRDNPACGEMILAKNNQRPTHDVILLETPKEKPSVYDIKAAMNQKDMERLDQLLTENNELLDQQFGENGDTPLMSAIEMGHDESVKIILNKGARIDLADGCGNTALNLAIFYGHHGIVTQLLNTGAQIDLADGCGMTALHYAATQKNAQMANLLLDHMAQLGERKDEHGNVVPLKDIINQRDNNGNTALHYARNSAEVFELLLGMAADLKIANNEGRSVNDIISDSKRATGHYKFDAQAVYKGWNQGRLSNVEISIDQSHSGVGNLNVAGNDVLQDEDDITVAGELED